MSEKVYGYVRVSSKEQNLDRQLTAMRNFGVPEEQIFSEKISGKNFERPVYSQLIEKIEPGDTLVVQSIDRLGRNYAETLEQWRFITKEKKAAIVVTDMSLLDTRQYRDLTGTLISDIVLQLLSYVAETERSFIHERQEQGIAAAKARGVHMGRYPKAIPEDFDEVFRRWKSGEFSTRKASRILGVSYRTFLKWTEQQ